MTTVRNDPAPFRIRRMEAGDISEVAEIEKLCFSEPWSEAVYRATLLLPYANFYVAEEMKEGGRILGMIGLENIAGEGEISNVAVRPQCRKQGIGHALMEHVLAAGADLGIRDFTLEVRAGNTAAIALYESFRFVSEGRRRAFYDRPVEDALIMWRREN